jgi:hypothetical protein
MELLSENVVVLYTDAWTYSGTTGNDDQGINPFELAIIF